MKTLTLSLLLVTLLVSRSASGGEIQQAAMKNDIEKVKALLSANPELVNSKSGESLRAPLHWAAWFGFEALADLLVAKGADVNVIDGGGQAPLHIAVVQKQKKMVDWLLAHKANVNARDINNETPLHYVETKEIAALLVAHKADVNAKEDHGWTPLTLAKRNSHKEVVDVLRQNGAK